MKHKVGISFRKVYSGVFFVFVLIFFSLAFGIGNRVASAYDNQGWSGEIANKFENGDGTINTPYEISSGEELAFLAQEVNAGNTAYNANTVYYKLTKNIILNNTANWKNWGKNSTPANEWTSIGKSESTRQFYSNFNGNNFSISGIYINTIDSSQGLFGYVNSGKISNLGIIESYIKGTDYIGGIAGQSRGSIENCYNTGYVSGTSENVGGVTGYIFSGSIKNCYNTGDISGSGNVGGVVGYFFSGTGNIENCYNTGNVFGSGNCVGGVAGYGRNSIKNCYNAGSISGSGNVGGIAGDNNIIEDCYNTGNVFGSSNCVGGVAGYNRNSIKSCRNTGSVSGSSNVGGIAGDNRAIITNCYNTRRYFRQQ